ncbi:uncharacterized protein LOC107360470 isoform X2 [Tetranychus urticae]|nr:uncharacterized protein LOC107360470 isoform X2 [Tetranychus urticae]XP_025016256.1 uncharacterized protein LOC107360470 isoform X2 [Tetranychus urticae]
MMITGIVQGDDERGRVIRRTLARYLLILQAVTFQAISISVKRRFPSIDHLVEAGIMTKEEQLAYNEIPGVYGKWWAPAAWFTTLAIRSRREGRIKDDTLLKHLLQELYKFRNGCGDLFAFDWISIPLVYTQAVTIAVYTYFAAVIMARQYLDPSQGYSGHEVDLYIPVFTLLEFFFFMGWLKVAEQLINPFGEDDDDFELNFILDRNLVVSMYIVDQMHNQLPKLVKDTYWDDLRPSLPYTKSSVGLRRQPYLGSAMNLDIHPEDSEFIPPSLETIMEDELISDTHHRFNQHGNSDLASPSIADQLVNFDYNTNACDISLGNGSRPQSSVSQSALNLLHDSFFGSRIINMIIGSSNENITPQLNGNVKNSKDKSGSHSAGVGGGFSSALGQFSLKSPRKRTRKISVPNNLKPSISSSLISKTSMEDFDRKMGSSASPHTGRHRKPISEFYGKETSSSTSSFYRHNQHPNQNNGYNPNYPDERRSLVIDLEEGANLESKLYSQTHLGSSQLSRAFSGSIDENGLGLSYPPSRAEIQSIGPGSSVGGHTDSYANEDGTASHSHIVPSSSFNNDVDPSLIMEGIRASPSIRSSETYGSSYSALNNYSSTQLGESSEVEENGQNARCNVSTANGTVTNLATSTSENDPDESADHSGESETFDHSSSHESLGPYGSNQSTVTSITQLLGKGNKEHK